MHALTVMINFAAALAMAAPASTQSTTGLMKRVSSLMYTSSETFLLTLRQYRKIRLRPG